MSLMNLLTIALTILPPVLILIGIGVVLDRWHRMDLPTLSKITFAVFVPALVFDKVLTSPLEWGEMGTIGLFAVLHVTIMGLSCWPLWWRSRWRGDAPVITLGAMFYNVGNIGFPIAALAFGEAGLAVIAILLMVQNLTSFTAGVLVAHGGSGRYTRGAGGSAAHAGGVCDCRRLAAALGRDHPASGRDGAGGVSR